MDLILKTTEYVNGYMSRYDASHDFNHIERVLDLAQIIEANERRLHPERALDSEVITLASLLHDVGDKKYLAPGESGETMAYEYLVSAGAPESLASKVQQVVTHVSYSSEIKDPDLVISLVEQVPELGIVQDADRLDALGAIGIGRCFTFGAAKGLGRNMEESIQHFEDKLVNLAGMMKTQTGASLAIQKTQRIHVFMAWWYEESTLANKTL